MRGVLVLALLVGACSYEYGLVAVDGAPPDMPNDVIVVNWQVDAQSKKAVPAAPFEWTELLRQHGVPIAAPNSLWLMQETTGNLADTIGGVTLVPTAFSPTYATAVDGWARAAVATTATLANHGFQNDAIGNLNGPSYLVLAYISVDQPTAEGSLFGIGAESDHRFVAITPAPVFKGAGIAITPTAGTVNPMDDVHPVILKLNAGQSEYVVYTDKEKIAVNWVPTVGRGPLLTFGNASIGAAPARYLYGALWSGSNAAIPDANVKKLLQALGWTVSGY